MTLSNMKRSQGFSLIELMIAGFLGLLLLTGVITVFLGSKESFRMQEQLSNVQSEGRFAMVFIERFARNAGWYEAVTPSLTSAIDFTTSIDGGAGGSDSITLQQEAPAGTLRDCNGTVVAGTQVRNTFSLNGTSLLCAGNGGAAPQPVVENVESFQVLYGIDSDSDGVINRYADAATVTGGGWERKVISIQIGLLVAAEANTMPSVVAKQFNVLDQVVNTNDSRLRRQFNKTVMLPNQAFVVVTQKP
ncbi:PilW family protein [Pleionea litopenaei]|uniref:PilW family protein n=1 Tax=Pleionea litopenaei TaxID=3070815 RepID=A0AA51RTW2_9GAMM|nr:PilW family protein [Pleionea sp. HL-JVS1]WMS87573.1 PilW family protein [Pleionea sp. HL-JVS1]